MRTRATALAGLAAVVLSACGGAAIDPIGEGPGSARASDGTAAGGAVDGCRPALTDDDPHPFDNAGGGQHAALNGNWVNDVAQQVHTRHVDVLAGLWLDNAAGELVVMVPGTEGREAFERLRADAPEPDRVVCMESTYTQAELEELQQEAFQRIAGARLVAGGGVDTIRNRVDIGVEDGLDAARDALGDLADHAALHLEFPGCAEVLPPPEGAVVLPGGGSNCDAMDALFTGTLRADHELGCAWLEGPDGGLQTVLWPRGWSLTEDGTILDHRGQPQARAGDRVDSGGGHRSLGDSYPDACRVGGEGGWVLGSLAPASDEP
jgi:hypothetical protein